MVIKENYSLKDYNTFHLDVSAKKFIELSTAEEITEYFKTIHDKSEDILILGGGSNVLFTRDFDGTIIHIVNNNIKVLNQDQDHVLVEADAGVVWDDLVNYTVENNYGGIENLALIPGTVGAAPIQNIGAYGVELKDVFHSLMAVEIGTGIISLFNHSDCLFGYRESVFKNELKNRYAVISVILKLTVNPIVNTNYKALAAKLDELNISSPGIKEMRDIIIQIRNSKLPDPEELGNAGSFFKNPVVSHDKFIELKSTYAQIPSFPVDDESVKVPAAWFIEHAGLKGFREGEVGTHEFQPLVIVNYGNAKGEDVINFANKIQKKVKEKFGIKLLPEVNIV